jgi:hypothetical protein
MEILQIKKKAQFLNTLGRFHTYDLRRKKVQMIDTFADIHNPIFYPIINYNNTHLEHPLPPHTPTPPPVLRIYPSPPGTSHDLSHVPTIT